MSISEKLKTISNKIEKNKDQYNLDKQTTMISALSSDKVSKYEFLTGKDVLPEKDLIEKAAIMKRFEYSPLGKELKALTLQRNSIKNYAILLGLTKQLKKKKKTLENYSKSNLIYDANHSFYRYYLDRKKLNNLSFKSKHSFLSEFFDDLDKTSNLNQQKESTKKRKIKVFDTASE